MAKSLDRAGCLLQYDPSKTDREQFTIECTLETQQGNLVRFDFTDVTNRQVEQLGRSLIDVSKTLKKWHKRFD